MQNWLKHKFFDAFNFYLKRDTKTVRATVQFKLIDQKFSYWKSVSIFETIPYTARFNSFMRVNIIKQHFKLSVTTTKTYPSRTSDISYGAHLKTKITRINQLLKNIGNSIIVSL